MQKNHITEENDLFFDCTSFITSTKFLGRETQGLFSKQFFTVSDFQLNIFKPEFSNHFPSDKSAMLKGCGYLLKSLHLKPNPAKIPLMELF